MKNPYILILFFILSFLKTTAQIQVSLNVDSNPTPEISEWVNRNNLAILTVTNTDPSMEDVAYKIKVEMYKDGDMMLETTDGVATQYIEMGTVTFLADEIIPYSAINFTNTNFRNHVLQTGMLPAGEYSFCVTLIDTNTNVISIPNPECKPMIFTDYQMPELIDPIEDKQVSALLVPTIVFNWTPVTPQPPADLGVKYILEVKEVLSGQSPAQAFHVNTAIIDEEDIMGTQFNWPSDLDAPDETTQYVWSVKPVSTSNDNPFQQGNNGFVSVQDFTVLAGDDLDNFSGEDECECTISGINSSNLLVFQPLPQLDPTLLHFTGINGLIPLIKQCNDADDPNDYSIEVKINWDNTHMNETQMTYQNISHDYDNHDIPEEICVTFIRTEIANPNNQCEISYCVDVPIEILNAINETALCECNNTFTIPDLTLSQPYPTTFPKKLQLGNVTQIRDAVRDCNNEYNEIDPQFNTYKYTFDTTINWDKNHNAESITNSGPFEHEYTATDSIPSTIAINVAIAPKPGYNGTPCTRTFTVNVPQNLQDLNIITPLPPSRTIAENDTIYAGHNSEFAIIVTQISESSGKYSGEGTAYIDWLRARMSVKYDSITVDTDKKLILGSIKAQIYDAPAPQYPQDWATEVVTTNNWANQQATDVVNWVENTSGQEIDYKGLTDYSTPVKLPLGVNMPNGDQLAMTELVFKPNESKFNMITAVNTPASWGTPQLVGFEAKNIAFHPNQIVMPPERVELIEDVIVENNINTNTIYTLKAPTSSNPGCYADWDENGFSQFGIELDVSFSRGQFIPLPDDGTSHTIVNFIGTGTAWNDLVITGQFPRSEIVNVDGMTILGNTISLDMSDTLNPPDMHFPDNYPAGAETTNLFKGFYMKQLEIELPEGMQTQSGGPPKVDVQDMIINHTGLTLYAEVTNIYQYPDVGMVDMSASIDSVKVSIGGGSLIEASIKGRLALPISKSDSVQNPLQYNAIFHVAQNPSEMTHFQLTIDPTGPINANLLKGTMTFDPTSSIIAYFDKNKRTFQTTLNGNFLWDNVTLGPVKNVNFDIGFQNLEFNYNSSLQNNKMQFNAGQWSFASPQKKLANFPVTIENIGFDQLPTTGNQMLHGKLNFDVIFNLSKDIGGQSSLGIELGIDEDATSSGMGKFKPRYLGTAIENIDVHANLSAVAIDGTILFRNNDPIYGDGFIGELSATFKTPKVGITALAEFGNTDYLYGSRYRYWRVEAAVIFTPGIPFLPGVAFYGFGGGAHNNMQAEVVEAAGAVPAHYTFKPKKGTMGFKVKATIGTTPKVETFNGDVSLNGQFSSTQGLINIGFEGAFYVGAPLLPDSKRQEAQIKGTMLADYNFPDKHFYFASDVTVNKDPITGTGRIVLDIKSKQNKWFFKFGEPNQPSTVSIFGVNLYQYLMFGNDIQAPVHGFTTDFYNSYYSAMGTYPGIPDAPGVDGNSATGKGLALGVGIKFNKGIDEHIVSGYNFYANMQASAEVNLSMMEYTGQNCQNTTQTIGLNGWRARGNIGFYTNAGIGVKKGGDNWPLAAFKIGGWIDAKFPRPTFVSGTIEGNVQIGGFKTKIHSLGDCKANDGGFHVHCKASKKVFGKTVCYRWYGRKSCTHQQQHYLVNTNFQSSFEWAKNGNFCAANDNIQPNDTGGAVTQQDAAADQEQNLIKYVHPGTTYNFPTTMPIAVQYGLPLNEEFDVTEQQSSGAILPRTFKLRNYVTLKKKNDNTGIFETIYVDVDQNNLGEYLYTKGDGVVTQVVASVSSNFALSSSNSSTNQQAANTMATMSVGRGGSNLQSATMSSATFTTYPAPTPPAPPETSEYDNLPPEAEPIVNSLEANKSYKISITATLKEYKNNQWVNAQKSDGSVVKQTITKFFRTGAMELQTANASNSVPSSGK